MNIGDRVICFRSAYGSDTQGVITRISTAFGKVEYTVEYDGVLKLHSSTWTEIDLKLIEPFCLSPYLDLFI